MTFKVQKLETQEQPIGLLAGTAIVGGIILVGGGIGVGVGYAVNN